MIAEMIQEVRIAPKTPHLLPKRTMLFLRALTCAFLMSCSSLGNGPSLNRAEQLAQEGRYSEAIATYREHIQERLNEPGRPEWENPNFYLLRIIDLQLKLAQPDDALRTCLEAEQRGIESSLISDRYRAIATWHEQRGDLHTAFEVLKTHRERDPLLFDAMLDRVGRTLTSDEH
jgi:hypothetical protein